MLMGRADLGTSLTHTGAVFEGNGGGSPVAQQPVEVLTEDALYKRFLQQELVGHAGSSRAPAETNTHNHYGSAREPHNQSSRQSSIGGLVGGLEGPSAHVAPKGNIAAYRKRDWISAGCAVKTVVLDVPEGVKVSKNCISVRLSAL